MAKERLSDAEIADAVRSLCREGRLDERLYDAVVTLARGHLRKNAGAATADEPEDAAVEFLLHVRQSNSCEITTYGLLLKQFRKFHMGRTDPSGHELWHICRDALAELKEDGLCCSTRLGSRGGSDNSELWYRPGQEANAFDRARFELDCARFDWSVYLPSVRAQAGGYREPSAKSRLIKPAVAQQIAMKLLELAGAPVTFSVLHAVFKTGFGKHTRTISTDSAPQVEQDDALRRVDRMHADVVRTASDWDVVDESEHRAGLIWTELTMANGRKVLCCYILPKTVGQRHVTLESLGNTSTIGDTSKQVYGVLGRYLRCDMSNTAGAATPEHEHEHVRAILIATVQELSRKCSENGFSCTF